VETVCAPQSGGLMNWPQEVVSGTFQNWHGRLF
jgi:hypothetical protein